MNEYENGISSICFFNKLKKLIKIEFKINSGKLQSKNNQTIVSHLALNLFEKLSMSQLQNQNISGAICLFVSNLKTSQIKFMRSEIKNQKKAVNAIYDNSSGYDMYNVAGHLQTLNQIDLMLRGNKVKAEEKAF